MMPFRLKEKTMKKNNRRTLVAKFVKKHLSSARPARAADKCSGKCSGKCDSKAVHGAK